jgi:hypothetical protein
MTVWYCEDDGTSHTFGWSALTARANGTAYTVGNIRKQDGSVTLGNERAYMCVVAGTSGAGSPTWTYTMGASITDDGVTWREVTGQPAVNGDVTNTVVWATGTAYVLTSAIIKNTAGTYYFICTTAGTSGGSEPSWDTTTGHTTADNTATWTCIGAVGAFAGYAAPFAYMQTPTGTGFMAAGDTLYVSDRHVQTQSVSFNLTSSNGTADLPLRIICVDHTATPPTALALTASVSTTGATYLRFCIYVYLYGLVFTCGSSSNLSGLAGAGLTNDVIAEHCTFNLGASFLLGYIDASATYANKVIMNDCTVHYGSTTHTLGANGGNVTFNRLTLTGSAPNNAFNTNAHANFVVNDSDLSLATSTLVTTNNATLYRAVFSNCKLGAGVTLQSGTLYSPFGDMSFYNCSSSNINYSYRRIRYEGTVDHELTTVRTSGASDGTTSISWKAVTGSTASFGKPMDLAPIAQWNETTGSALTATVEIAGAASLTNGDIWLEIEYLGDAASCVGSVVSSRRGLLATAAAVTTSSASWGGSPTYKQKLQCAFTPQEKGPVVARVYVAKASATVYVDPMMTIA